MRKLTKKQQKLCIEYLEKGGNVSNVDWKLKVACEKINDYETLYTDIERFVYDYYFNNKKRYTHNR